jgi:hypothetical protein
VISLAENHIPNIKEWTQSIGDLQGHLQTAQSFIRQYYLPLTAGLFLFTGLILWVILRASLAKQVRQTTPVKAKEASKPKFQKKEQKLKEQRLYIHLMGVLQREGRLMDFFTENLEPFEDAQIGAAVRNIHENCSQIIQKYLSPSAVLDQPEGDEVTVPEGFDASTIKLIGNVSGNPPFKGILRHKGWQARKLEMPILSSSQDAAIISPAEVEIF